MSLRTLALRCLEVFRQEVQPSTIIFDGSETVQEIYRDGTIINRNFHEMYPGMSAVEEAQFNLGWSAGHGSKEVREKLYRDLEEALRQEGIRDLQHRQELARLAYQEGINKVGIPDWILKLSQEF